MTQPSALWQLPSTDPEATVRVAIGDATPPGTVPTPPSDSAPLTLSQWRYRVVQTLTDHAAGSTVLAEQLALGRTVAVKVTQDVQRRAQLAREAQLTAQVEHPRVPAIHDAGDGVLVMQHVRGKTLASMLADGSAARDAPATIEVLKAVAEAVAFAHSRGVAHTAITLDRIIVGDYGLVQLIDWSSAVAVEPAGAATAHTAGDVEQLGRCLAACCSERASAALRALIQSTQPSVDSAQPSIETTRRRTAADCVEALALWLGASRAEHEARLACDQAEAALATPSEQALTVALAVAERSALAASDAAQRLRRRALGMQLERALLQDDVALAETTLAACGDAPDSAIAAWRERVVAARARRTRLLRARRGWFAATAVLGVAMLALGAAWMWQWRAEPAQQWAARRAEAERLLAHRDGPPAQRILIAQQAVGLSDDQRAHAALHAALLDEIDQALAERDAARARIALSAAEEHVNTTAPELIAQRDAVRADLRIREERLTAIDPQRLAAQQSAARRQHLQAWLARGDAAMTEADSARIAAELAAWRHQPSADAGDPSPAWLLRAPEPGLRRALAMLSRVQPTACTREQLAVLINDPQVTVAVDALHALLRGGSDGLVISRALATRHGSLERVVLPETVMTAVFSALDAQIARAERLPATAAQRRAMLLELATITQQQRDRARSSVVVSMLYPARADQQAHRRLEMLLFGGDAQRSERESRAHLQEHPGCALANQVLVHSLFRQSRLAELIAVDLPTDDATGWELRACAFLFLGRRDEARACVPMMLGPSSRVQSTIQMVNVLTELELYDEARREIGEWIAMCERTPRDDEMEAYEELARLERRLRRFDQALEVADRMIERWPHRAVPHQVRAITLLLMPGRLDEAWTSSQRALAIQPRNAAVLYDNARCWFALQRADLAVHRCLRAVAQEPARWSMYRDQVIDWSLAAGFDATALEWLQRSAALDAAVPRHALVHVRLLAAHGAHRAAASAAALALRHGQTLGLDVLVLGHPSVRAWSPPWWTSATDAARAVARHALPGASATTSRTRLDEPLREMPWRVDAEGRELIAAACDAAWDALKPAHRTPAEWAQERAWIARWREMAVEVSDPGVSAAELLARQPRGNAQWDWLPAVAIQRRAALSATAASSATSATPASKVR